MGLSLSGIVLDDTPGNVWRLMANCMSVCIADLIWGAA
jgi:hypothetical protein